MGKQFYIADDVIEFLADRLKEQTLTEILREEFNLSSPDNMRLRPDKRDKKPRGARWKWPVHMLSIGAHRDFATREFNSVSQSSQRQAKKYGMEFHQTWTMSGIRVTRIK